jgi:hypothetical protein
MFSERTFNEVDTEASESIGEHHQRQLYRGGGQNPRISSPLHHSFLLLLLAAALVPFNTSALSALIAAT